MTPKEHNKLIGIFHLVQGGLQAFGGVIIGLIYGGMGAFFAANAHRQEEQMMGTFFVIFAFVIAAIMLVLAAVNFTAGYKLVKEKSGARTWGIVASIVCLIGFPLGTALGIYGLWFLFGEEGKQYYLGQNMRPQAVFPPQPNSWQ